MLHDAYHTIQELKDHVRALGGTEYAKDLNGLYTQRTELSIALFNRQDGHKWKFVSEPGWFAYGWEHPTLGMMGYHAMDLPTELIEEMIAKVPSYEEE